MTRVHRPRTDRGRRGRSDEPDGLDDLDVLGSSGGCEADARQAGDDAVGGLDKITAQMAGGEHRPEQQEMCRAVAEAMVTGTHLVVQAGTGTGKSLAYLVPAALSGKKVVVATATKALQDQLAEKDLPLVEAGLGPAGAAGLRRAEGAQQLRLPPAGGRGGLGWDPGRAGRPAGPAADEPERGRGAPRSGGAEAGAPRPRASSRRCASWWRGRRRRRAATGPT